MLRLSAYIAFQYKICYDKDCKEPHYKQGGVFMLVEKLLTMPGFIYEVSGNYYYLGKWICKMCTDTDASDCVMMYQMCRRAGEEPDTNLYFQKIRAYSDFALEVPYNPIRIREDMEALADHLTDSEREHLQGQIQNVEEDIQKYS